MPIRLEILEGANPHSAENVIRIFTEDAYVAVPIRELLRLKEIVEKVQSCLGLGPAPLPDYLTAGQEVAFLDAVAVLAIAIQRRGGQDFLRCGKARVPGYPPHVAWAEIFERETGEAAFKGAYNLVTAALRGGEASVLVKTAETGVEDFLTSVYRTSNTSPNERIVSHGARRLGIPFRWPHSTLNQFELGFGARSVRAEQTHFELESSIATRIQMDKYASSVLLRDAGIRVPRLRAVRSEHGALKAAEALGYPLVCKPRRGSRARGITLRIENKVQLLQGLQTALAENSGAVIEEYIPGVSYRFLVIRGQLIHTFERRNPSVTGDGTRSIRELWAERNAGWDVGGNWRFRYRHVDVERFDLPDAPFRELGYDLDTVPKSGETVILSYFSGNINGGATAPCKRTPHPDYHWIAKRTADTAGMPVLAIDFISRDIEAPPTPDTYAVHEINAWPSLNPYLREGPEDRSVDQVLSLLFGPPETLRVPLILIIVDAASRNLSAAVKASLEGDGRTVSCTSRDGYVCGDWEIAARDHSAERGFQRVLSDRQAEVIVAERMAEEVHNRGLSIDWADAVVFVPPEDPARSAAYWEHAAFAARHARAAITVAPSAHPAMPEVDALVWGGAVAPSDKAKRLYPGDNPADVPEDETHLSHRIARHLARYCAALPDVTPLSRP